MTINTLYRNIGLVLGFSLFVWGCAAEPVVQNLDEREANVIYELLADSNIVASKQMVSSGRDTFFVIAVAPKDKLNAIRLLNKHQLPRRKSRGYAEVFAEGGLIPTASEEKAKKLSALEGEIEKQIKVIEGVLDVEVQIVMPDESPLRSDEDQEIPTTASATIKYMPGANSQAPLSREELQKLVSAGVEKLAPENVVVVMLPAGGVVGGTIAASSSVSEKTVKQLKNFRYVSYILGGFAIAASLFAILMFLRLRSVRGRLLRLQNEIAKARRKVEPPAPA